MPSDSFLPELNLHFVAWEFYHVYILNSFSGGEESGGSNILVSSLVPGTVAERYESSLSVCGNTEKQARPQDPQFKKMP
jgi:hypothetical protein